MDAKNKERPEEEKEADYFATCLLIPEKLILTKKKEFEQSYLEQAALFKQSGARAKNEDLIKFLTNIFKVSAEAMRYRLNGLGKI